MPPHLMDWKDKQLSGGPTFPLKPAMQFPFVQVGIDEGQLMLVQSWVLF